jgi:DNA-binding PadR family transcriptional regulator
MYRDNTLVPREAVRLLALGLLGTREMTYARLAAEVRHFTTHVVGPSLDLVASPVELLKVEGLVAAVEDTGAGDEQETLRITETGRAELDTLLKSNVRPGISDINKLIITLKIRFLHLLEPEDRDLQIEMIAEMFERQLVRLTELRAHHAEAAGVLSDWLDHEIEQTRNSVTWFENLRAKTG